MLQKILLCCVLLPPALHAQGAAVSASNPGISLIGDIRGTYTDDLPRKFDFLFNEAELSLLSSIDPYARADVYIGWSRDDDGEYISSLEEAYLTTLSLPMDLRMKAGRFRLSVGRLNTVHPHALPFTDVPRSSETFFGEEGLIDDGISVSWLVPNQLGFYQELIIEASAVPAESPLFRRPESGRYLYLAHLKNFLELSDNSTLELGLTGLTGPNQDLKTTSIGGIDLTYKWKPLQFNRYKSVTWQTEVFLSEFGEAAGGSVRSLGLYSFLTYQLGERWFATGRFDYADLPRSAGVVLRGYTATLGWYATEFQKIEIGGTLQSGTTTPDRTEITLRWIFVIGAHGAHQY